MWWYWVYEDESKQDLPENGKWDYTSCASTATNQGWREFIGDASEYHMTSWMTQYVEKNFPNYDHITAYAYKFVKIQ